MKKYLVIFVVAMLSIAPVFSQPSFGEQLKNFQGISTIEERDRKAQLRKDLLKIAAVVVIFSGIAVVVIRTLNRKEKEKKNVQYTKLSERIKRAMELIEKGMDKKTVFEILKSEGLIGDEISDVYYKAFHIYLKKQEKT